MIFSQFLRFGCFFKTCIVQKRAEADPSNFCFFSFCSSLFDCAFRTLDRILASEHVEVTGFQVANTSRRPDTTVPLIEKQIFVANFESNLSESDEYLRTYEQAVRSFLMSNANVLEKQCPGIAKHIRSNELRMTECNALTHRFESEKAHFLQLLRDLVQTTQGKKL